MPSSSWKPASSDPMRPRRPPSPGIQPPTTSSATRRCLILIQAPLRLPGSYGLSSRLATTPSSPCAQLRIGRSDLAPAATPCPRAAALDRYQRPDPVPFDLVPVGVVGAGQRAGPGEHRPQVLRHGLPPRHLGRVHAVDHPVLAAGLEQGVAAPEPLAAEGADHLVVAELFRLVGAAVPDLHVAGAVLSRRYVPLELKVLERVVLHVDGEMVALG